MKKVNQAKAALNEIIYGQEEVVDLIFTAIIAEGHVLLESVPGTGKTKLAKSFATVMKGNYNRIQFNSRRRWI